MKPVPSLVFPPPPPSSSLMVLPVPNGASHHLNQVFWHAWLSELPSVVLATWVSDQSSPSSSFPRQSFNLCEVSHHFDDWENTWISEEYMKWEQQVQLLLSWLQSTISREIETRVSGFASTRGNLVKKFMCIFTQAPSRRLITHQREVSSASLWISRHYCGKSFCLLISTSNSNINWSTIWFYKGGGWNPYSRSQSTTGRNAFTNRQLLQLNLLCLLRHPTPTHIWTHKLETLYTILVDVHNWKES
jgi:hypothetical protein